jgi:hypothetical protein
MKKVILGALLLLSIVSCKKELPDNIKSKIDTCEFYYELGKENDSIIISMSKNDIDKLKKEDIEEILRRQEMSSKNYKSSEEELDEILKYNPEYSNYDDVKNMKKPYSYKNLIKYYENISYLDTKLYDITLNELKIKF